MTKKFANISRSMWLGDLVLVLPELLKLTNFHNRAMSNRCPMRRSAACDSTSAVPWALAQRSRSAAEGKLQIDQPK